MRADKGRRKRHELLETSRALGKCAGEPTEVVQDGVHGGRETNAGVLVFVPKGFLEQTKEAARAGECDGHGAKLAENLVPISQRDALTGRRDGVQDLVEPLKAVRGQVQKHAVGIDYPAQDHFDGGPGGISFTEFLNGRGFLAVLGV